METVDAPDDVVRYRAMRWNTPLSDAHASTLLAGLDMADGMSVLDLGCGWGELLLRAVAAAGPRSSGVGVDHDPGHLARAIRRAGECGMQHRVRFVRGQVQEWGDSAERVICIGVSHAWGGTSQALCALRRAVPDGGRLLFGDGCWEARPAPRASAIFGDSVLPLDRLIATALSAGWRVLRFSTADQREWDDFECDWRLARQLWAIDNPSAPEVEQLQAALDERLMEYVGAYRRSLGFCYLTLA